ncbi:MULTISPECIES: EAL domain-containing response regulator [Paraburkholderia]|uniref:EAL domain-containing protein n=1 Tax=Paraburkholderia dioscoreae TaxID=2604047 RepID=A0A5Q4ZP15_9BURK|nr:MULTISPECIES: EAL domain-containing response regulator [Paraburkholderia]MDR8396520.1 EAL domain-containing response regulator [Paraburkholderia sp. USG1]VVD34099.1 EAL domain-containing protein [Paraburkholderia dioscoreae]
MRDLGVVTHGTVLIIEDDPVQSKVLQSMTTKLGFDVCTAASLNEARERLGTLAIDTVLLDLRLGNEAGLDVLRSMRGKAAPRSLILTSGCDERTRTAAVRLAHAYGVHVAGSLGKPVTLGQLSDLLCTMPACAWKPTPREVPRVTRADVAAALEGGHIRPHFQPKVCLASGGITGVEALARWRSPLFGNVPPDVFIPVIEAEGLSRKFTHFMLRESLRACAAWRHFFPDVSVAVNVSPALVDQELMTQVIALLHETHVPAESLILEITETSALGCSIQINDVLTRLRIFGVQLSIDDFGTGHSSLASLFRLPFNELKLDRLFTANADRDQDAERILRAVVAMANEMGLRCVAEGVETEAVRHRLARMGCSLGQGWLWSPAVAEEELINVLNAAGTRPRDPHELKKI